MMGQQRSEPELFNYAVNLEGRMGSGVEGRMGSARGGWGRRGADGVASIGRVAQITC
jgi:hypothetical protein